ncbi:recombinase family protein [Mycolicibacterium conceptionense]|uniref:recombinase family protein n=1 Tax=Mycolicibacterium conceptionense TaxID=451644 RepID=UPI0006627F18|nr:recombinase family protein [Mycolicibacterium conceptionense]
MATMNLTDYAQTQGISYATARRWFDAGTLPHPARKAGRLILVDLPDPEPESPRPAKTAAYVCVTSPQEFDKRVKALRRWAGSHGIGINLVVADEDGSHQKLLDLLSDRSITRILTDRAGFDNRDLLAAALAADGREFITTSAQSQKLTRPIPFKPRIAQGTGA